MSPPFSVSDKQFSTLSLLKLHTTINFCQFFHIGKTWKNVTDHTIINIHFLLALLHNDLTDLKFYHNVCSGKRCCLPCHFDPSCLQLKRVSATTTSTSTSRRKPISANSHTEPLIDKAPGRIGHWPLLQANDWYYDNLNTRSPSHILTLASRKPWLYIVSYD